ncbi:MAG: hypothetical protein J0H83_15920 [Candidatus Melainabacteria bacterium]|nr:hypothetical protein [Candidatus Melainabacteria bacterium]
MRNDVKTRSLLLSLVQICLLAVFALGPITAVWAADAKSAKSAEEADCCKAESKGKKAAAPENNGDLECEKCAKVCKETIAYFKSKGGKYTEGKNVQILEDCIRTCETSADFIRRGSSNASKIQAVCKEICKQCAQMCKSMNDPKLKDCIQSCLECEACCDMHSKK